MNAHVDRLLLTVYGYSRGVIKGCVTNDNKPGQRAIVANIRNILLSGLKLIYIALTYFFFQEPPSLM